MIRKPYLILSIIMVMIIWTNSLLPASISSAQSGFFVSLASRFLDDIGISHNVDILSLVIRKFAHFGQFLVLGFLLFLTFAKYQYIYMLVMLVASLVAIIDESIQIFSPGRYFSFIDFLIDIAGAFLECWRFVY